jgi:membrane associated rhomboid family serine protease
MRQKSIVVPVLIFLNVLVFLNWIFAINGNPEFMFNNFLVSWKALLEGRYWTLITSVFSHNLFWHLFLNMYVLFNFGLLLEQILGRSRFLFFYLIAGIVSSLSHSLVSAFVIGDPEVPALGASGAISGLIMVFSFMFPKQKLLFFGLIPVPALFGALAFVGLDLWGLLEQAKGSGLPIGHGAHLGGAFIGICYYFFYLRPKVKSRYNTYL